MEYLFYIRLIGFTAGTLVFLFLLVLLAGLRRPRLFESCLFLLGICFFLFYSGGLLEMNLEIYYPSPPLATQRFALALTLAGLSLLPALLVAVSLAAEQRQTERKISTAVWGLWLLPFALPLPFLINAAVKVLSAASTSLASPPLGWAYAVLWTRLQPAPLGAALLISAGFQIRFAGKVANHAQATFHKRLAFQLALVGLLGVLAYLFFPKFSSSAPPGTLAQVLGTLFWLSLVILGAQLGYYFVRQRFLPVALQRSLILTVTAGFLALLYLTVALRISSWLTDYLPPVATLSVLLFVLVIFFEPLQRRMSAVLGRTFRAEAEQLQRLTAEIQHVARAGNLAELITFSETRIRESFSLSGVRIPLHHGPARPATVSGNVQRFSLRNGPAEIGVLEAYFFGQTLSGETHAALDYLSEQLPAAIDLCRLLDEKLRLERELAERERLALLGQMAASVSHNLRNPLSSIKALLQLQLENPELPVSARPDCEKAVAEVDRLNTKLTQLLRYAKPAVRAGSGAATARVDAAALAAQTVSLLQHEAERRGVALTLEGAGEKIEAAATEEALSDVLSNLIVNAIEAVPTGGAVRVWLARRDANIVLEILDDGPGIPESVRPRIFQPFFTTKPTGTGLGLAIVEKRLAEIGATIDCESPVLNARGTRFIVTLKGG